jgi:hypothetical protein
MDRESVRSCSQVRVELKNEEAKPRIEELTSLVCSKLKW